MKWSSTTRNFWMQLKQALLWLVHHPADPAGHSRAHHRCGRALAQILLTRFQGCAAWSFPGALLNASPFQKKKIEKGLGGKMKFILRTMEEKHRDAALKILTRVSCFC